MPTQRESRIENFAFDYLKNFYAQRHTAKDVFVYMGEASKNGALADGLFTYQKSHEEPVFVATLVTEHSEKLAAMLTSYKNKAFKKTSIAIAFLASIAACSLAFGLTGNILLSGVVLAGIGSITYILSRLSYKVIQQRQMSNMLHTFKRLPANEKWLGISVSSRTLRNNVLAQSLLQMCRQKGIGIITVGKRSKVVLVQEPGSFTRRQGDFLSFYKSEFSIRKEMSGGNIMRVA